MFCPHCGTPSVTGSGYCSVCGKALSADAPTTGPHRPAVDATRVGDTTRREVAETVAIERVIGDRYHVIKLLGVGGMGAVYQAWDDKLGVAVALKVILRAEGPQD